jgi:peptidoglycan/xylan/chitin deacetylase (PgdA/CDA1 family)
VSEPVGGSLVISLDFELHWGVRDVHAAGSAYAGNLLGAREAVPRLLDLFTGFDVAATWATVGFLMAESREELESFHPRQRARYTDPRLDPYTEALGAGERDDPIHFAPSLVRLISATPRQEIGTHTYSHYYCLEEGADAESFRQDITSAVALARARGLDLKSLVLPRNQWNPAYESIVLDAGIECYRGTQPGWMYDPVREKGQTRIRRLARLADAHLPLTSWAGADRVQVAEGARLKNVPATCFLRPVTGSAGLNRLRLRRITRGMTQAALDGRAFHLWWHPHNFGHRTEDNLTFLQAVLEHFRTLACGHGMRSLSMAEACRHMAAVKPT